MSRLGKALAWMFRCCGIAPARNCNDKYFTALAMVLFISMAIMRTVSFHTVYNSFEAIIRTIILSLLTVGAAGFVMRNWYKPERYMNIMKYVESDEFGSTDKKESQKYIWVIIPTVLITQVVIIYHYGVYVYITILLSIIMYHGPLLQSIVLIDKIHKQFSAVNNMLVGLAAESDISIISTNLDSTFRSHSTLQALVVDVDLHFCFYNLFAYISKFTFCVTIMYDYLNYIETPEVKLVFGFGLWFFTHIVLFICQALVCHSCSQEANRTALLAHRVLQTNYPIDQWEKVGLFSALGTSNKVQFTVGGIFSLDRSLITHTFLAALSYLIIAVQLRDVKLVEDNVSDTTMASVLLGMNSSLVIFHNED